MADPVVVKIEYHGRRRDVVGSVPEVLSVPPVLAQAHYPVCAYVSDKDGIVLAYRLLFNATRIFRRPQKAHVDINS